MAGRSVRRSQTYQAVRAVAHSALFAVFSKKNTRIIQAILVSGVFLIYLFLPRIEPLCRAVGLVEVNGRSIGELLLRFEEIAGTWALPESLSSEELLSFILGNQGLVLLFLLWSIASLAGWPDIAGRLKDVPNLCRSRLSRFFADFHIVIFYFYFLPFLIFAALLIPVVGSSVIGYSLAILLGVFAFGLFLPRIVSYLLSLGYLVVTIMNSNTSRDTVNINEASNEELTLLPGIGVKLARKIIAGRPYAKINDLMSIEGFGGRKFANLRHLIRV